MRKQWLRIKFLNYIKLTTNSAINNNNNKSIYNVSGPYKWFVHPLRTEAAPWTVAMGPEAQMVYRPSNFFALYIKSRWPCLCRSLAKKIIPFSFSLYFRFAFAWHCHLLRQGRGDYPLHLVCVRNPKWVTLELHILNMDVLPSIFSIYIPNPLFISSFWWRLEKVVCWKEIMAGSDGWDAGKMWVSFLQRCLISTAVDIWVTSFFSPFFVFF